jgi:hypothetical protein
MTVAPISTTHRREYLLVFHLLDKHPSFVKGLAGLPYNIGAAPGNSQRVKKTKGGGNSHWTEPCIWIFSTDSTDQRMAFVTVPPQLRHRRQPR